jgi:fused signal recognition particle receptor
VATEWEDILDLGEAVVSPVSEVAPEEERKGAFRRLRESLARSRRALTEEVGAGLFDRVDEGTWERLEEALILADAGAGVTARVVGRLEQEVEGGEIPAEGDAIRERLIQLIAEIASSDVGPVRLSERPAVLLVTGVNGTGKTTSIGKLAWRLTDGFGLSVLLGAADTFRAAAAEQLETWADRSGSEIVRSQQGADPGSVAFDAIAAGFARGSDVVIIDTAGRLHTRESLMEELGKVRRVIERQLPGAPHETLLVIDATTGQNGLRQARAFAEALPVDGVVLTKLDGTAKGGIALAINEELGIPVKFIGTGEGLDDLRPFDADEFARALIGDGRD